MYDTCIVHVRYMFDTRPIHCITGVKKIESYQNAYKKLKVKNLAGVIVQHYSELQKWALAHKLPETKDEIMPFELYAVPFDGTEFKDVEAVVLTMHVQINWIGILVHLEFYWCLHIDGKYKLHHGDWMLVTYGTHSIHSDKRNRIRHTFRPLIYMFVKQQESTDCIFLGLTCLNFIAQRFFQKSFSPRVGVADHGPGLSGGWKKFSSNKLLGCYPHITWHLTHGKLLPKVHPLFDEACEVVRVMHMCETEGMWNVLLTGLARKWGNDDEEINKLWNSIFVAPYANWYLGYDTNTPLTYPSQQTQENWHNSGVMLALGRELGASTERLLEVNFPKIMKLDAANKADKLTFSIEREWLPTEMYKKAAKNLADPSKYVKVVDDTSLIHTRYMYDTVRYVHDTVRYMYDTHTIHTRYTTIHTRYTTIHTRYMYDTHR